LALSTARVSVSAISESPQKSDEVAYLFLLMVFCLIFVPYGHYDQPEKLHYENHPICPKGADGRQKIRNSTVMVSTIALVRGFQLA